jgi:sulfite exporter TauE/SafE
MLSAVRLALDATSFARPAQAVIALVAAAFTLYVGLSLLGLLPDAWSLERGPLARVGARVCHSQWGRVLRGGPQSRFPVRGRMLGLGVLNGYLPCGPVLAAAFIAAAAPTAPATALGMGIFGLGTLPGLVLVAYGTRRLSSLWRPRLYRVAGALVLVAGTQLGLRGLAATGIIDHLALGRVGIY